MGQELACCAGRRHGGDHDARQPPPALSPEVVQTFKRMRRASTRAGDIPMHTYRAEYRMKRRSASALPARRPVELHDPGSLVGGIHRDGRGEFVARFPNPAFVSPLAPSPRSSSPSAGWATPSPRGSESPRCPPLHVGPEHARRAAATAEGMTGNLEGGAEDVEDLGGVELPMEEVEGPSAGAAGLVVHVPAAPEANPDLSTMRRNSDCSPMSSPGFRPAPPLETAHGAEADDPIPPDAMDNLVCMEASTQGWTPLITGRRPAHLRLYRMEAPDDTPGTLRVKYFVALPDHDPDTVYRFLFDLDLRVSWERATREMRVLKPIDDSTDMIYTACTGFMDTDFVDFRRWSRLPDGGMAVIYLSTEVPDMPAQASYTRVRTLLSGFIVRAAAACPPHVRSAFPDFCNTGTVVTVINQSTVPSKLPSMVHTLLKWGMNKKIEGNTTEWREQLVAALPRA